MATKFGLDLGYANITLSDVSAGIYREPAVALIDKNTRRIISVGNAAVEQSDELNELALLVRPFKNGLLFDRQITQSVITHATRDLQSDERIRCVIGLPSDLLPKQEKEIFEMLAEAGITDCYSVNRAVAALVGAGYSPQTNVISVNVGASATEIAIFYSGKVIYTSRSIIGGEDFDKAVKQYIFDNGGVNVSLSVARAIKEKLGSVWSGREEETVDIEGTLALTGNRIRMTISSEDIVGVFEKPLHQLLMAVADAVKKIPVDAIPGILQNGVVLTGGGAMMHGIETMMSKVLGIPVTKPDDPIDSVARGLASINSLIPVKGRAVAKNVTNMVSDYYKEKTK